MTASLEQGYATTEAQLKRLFEWPGSEEEGRIAAAIRRRKITRLSGGSLLVDKLPDALDTVLDNLEYLPSSEDSHGVVWILLRHVQELIGEKKTALAGVEQRKTNPSLDQALNEGDGVYRP